MYLDLLVERGNDLFWIGIFFGIITGIIMTLMAVSPDEEDEPKLKVITPPSAPVLAPEKKITIFNQAFDNPDSHYFGYHEGFWPKDIKQK